MKKYTGFLLATAGGVAAASAAQAADLPMKAGALYAPAPIDKLGGFYIGAHAGANWQHADNQYDNSSVIGSTNAMGFIGGGQIGYNWQHGNFVYGVEVDAPVSPAREARTGGYTCLNEIRWLSTRARAVGLAVGDTMLYATGGLAVGGVKNSVTVCCAPSPSRRTRRASAGPSAAASSTCRTATGPWRWRGCSSISAGPLSILVSEKHSFQVGQSGRTLAGSR